MENVHDSVVQKVDLLLALSLEGQLKNKFLSVLLRDAGTTEEILLLLCLEGQLKKKLLPVLVHVAGTTEILKQGFEPELSQPLHYASAYGNLKVVRELVESYGCDPVCQNQYGITPLHCASYRGQLHVVKYLQKYYTGATAASIEDKHGISPLAYSAYCTMKKITVNPPLKYIQRVPPHNGHVQIAKVLLKLSSSEKNQWQGSSLSKVLRVMRLTVHSGSPNDLKAMGKMLKFMLTTYDEFDLEVYKCLKIAVSKGKWEFVTCLLSTFSKSIQAADSAWVSPWDLTPFQKACMTVDISKVKLVLEQSVCKPDVVAINKAIDRGEFELVCYLLDSAIAMHQYSRTNPWTSLLSCILASDQYRDEKELVDLVAANSIIGGDINGNTVLHLACKYSVQFLVEKHCKNQSKLNNKGQLPLHIACSQCSLAVVKLVSSQPGINVDVQDSDGNTPVHVACTSGRVIEHSTLLLRYLVLEKECDVNIQNNNGELPIHILNYTTLSPLLSNEREELIRMVTNKESFNNINAQDIDGNTPLHCACEVGDWKTAFYLLSTFDCDVNLCNNDGNLPVHYACSFETDIMVSSLTSNASTDITALTCVKAVSEKCTRIHTMNNSGMTPLHHACRKALTDVVRYLVFNKKCSPNDCEVTDMYDNLEIHLACENQSDIDLLKALANHENVNNYKNEYYERNTCTPLHIACTNHNLEAIKLLKELNCDFTLKDDQGMLPLHIACSQSLDCVKLLVVREEDVKLQDRNGNTPLHLACKHNLKDAVIYLLSQFKCDLTAKNRDGEFPLHLACSATLDIVRIVSQCNINHQANNGNTPLHIACRAGKMDVVNYLINVCKCESSMTLRNDDGRLPVHYACKHSLEMMKLVFCQSCTLDDLISRSFIEYGGIIDSMSALDIACSHGVYDIVAYLFNQKGVTLSALENDHRPLWYACGLCEIDHHDFDILNNDPTISSCAHPYIVEYLITECGYDPLVPYQEWYFNLTTFEHACRCNNLELMKALTVLSVDMIDDKGNTPLHYACQYSCTDIVHFLVNHGCSQTILNHKGELALHIACRTSLELTKLLKPRCDVNSKDTDGNTALHIACYNQKYDIMEYLLQDEDCRADIPNNFGCLPLHVAMRCYSHYLGYPKEVVQRSAEETNVVQNIIKSEHTSTCHQALTMKLLQKCDPNAQDANGNTALHIACAEQRYHIIIHLLEKGLCRSDIPNNSGDLPLHIVCKWSNFTTEANYDEEYKKYTPMLAIKKLLQQCDINSQDAEGNIALHIACSNEDYELVKCLLNDDRCVADITNKSGDLPLHILIKKWCHSTDCDWRTSFKESEQSFSEEMLQVVRMLVTRHSEATSAVDLDGISPIIFSVRIGSIHLLKALSIRPEVDGILLLTACKYGHVELVRWLIRQGCSTKITDDDGNLPAHLCIDRGNHSLEVLAEISDLEFNKQNMAGDTILHLACHYGDVSVLNHLLSFYNCISAFSIQNIKGETPLHLIASKWERSAEVLKLVKCGNPNLRDKDGNTPLHIACRHNNIQFASLLLLTHKSNPNIANNQGELPVHLAAARSLELVELVGRSENVNEQTKDGDTPLHVACQHHFLAIISHLIIKLKCSVQILNVNLDSPFHILLSKEITATAILSYIPKSLGSVKNKSGYTLLHLACKCGNFETVSFLIKSLKCNSDDTNNNSGVTPLHFACSRRLTGMAKLVSNCNPLSKLTEMSSLKDYNFQVGDTPLHVACRTGNSRIVEHLLKVGHVEALQACNSLNELPFHLSCHYNKDLINVFVQYHTNFDCNAVDAPGDTPLHAFCRGSTKASYLALLVNQIGCNTAVINKDKDLPLHIACKRQVIHLKAVKVLCSGLSDDQISLQNNSGNTALHELLKCKHVMASLFDVVGYLIQRMPNLSICNKEGEEPIDLACRHHRVKVVRCLCEHYCHNLWKIPSKVLQEACINNNPDVLKYIVSNFKHVLDFSIANKDGDLPLHLAARKKICMKGTILLVKETEDVNHTNKDGNTPLHELYHDNYQDGHTHYHQSDTHSQYDTALILKSFLKRKDIDVSIQNLSGQTALHCLCLAVKYDDLESVFSVCGKRIDVNVQDKEGLTLLHIVCRLNRVKAVQLLSSANANPCIKDNQGQTPIMMTNNPEIIKILIDHGADPQPLYDMHTDFFKEFSSKDPPPTPVKVLVVGNPSVGKTTLVESLVCDAIASSDSEDGFYHTAGVVPTNFSSNIYGDVIFFDFAGQREYYASHDAIIHNTIKNVPPIVLILVNLTDSKTKICREACYWINFISKRCAGFSGKAHIIIVCSHADKIESRGEDASLKVSKFRQDIASDLESKDDIMVLKDFVHMDCTKANSNEMEQLQGALKISTNELRQAGVMRFHSHCFYVLLLQEFKNQNVISLGLVISRLKHSSNSEIKSPLHLLPSGHIRVIQMCKDLDDKGHIMFIEHSSHIDMSWLVLNKEPLLHDLLGVLFAPSSFPQHRPLSYSTGVVPLSLFKKHFCEPHNYTAMMKLTFLTRMEYCREITDKAVLKSIVEQEGYSKADKYYFFPNLVSLERPTDKWHKDPQYPYKCGWLIQCKKGDDFFSPHFIQALLLRLAFAFVPKDFPDDSSAIEFDEDEDDDDIEQQAMTLVIKRVCSVWKNGIYWQEPSGVITIVDIIDERTLVLLIQCPHGSKIQLIKRRSSVMSMVLNAKKEFCPNATIAEYFLHPQCVEHPLILSFDKSLAFPMSRVNETIITRQPCVINNLAKCVDIQELLYFEPYAELSPDTIKKLFHEDNSPNRVNHDFLLCIASQLQDKYEHFVSLCHATGLRTRNVHTAGSDDAQRLLEIFIHVKEKWTYQDLRGFFNQISIFCGRKPPQVVQLNSQGDAVNDKADHAGGLTMSSLPKLHEIDHIESQGKVVRVIEHVASRWMDVATRLHFEHHDIDRIAEDSHHQTRKACHRMFREWLTGKFRKPINWETLIKALNEANFSVISSTLQIICKRTTNY